MRRHGSHSVKRSAPYRVDVLGTTISYSPSQSQPLSVSTRSFTVNISSALSRQVIPVNSARKSLLIQNLSGDTVYANIDAPASASPIAGIAIFTGGNYEPSFVPTGAIWLIGTTASQDVVVMEGF